MPYGWDPTKNEANIAKDGVAFDTAEGFDWATASVEVDTRFDYREVRLMAGGLIGGRLQVLVFTIRTNTTWIISLRKANAKEVRRYASEG